MNKNIKVAKELIKIAKDLIAITMTRKDFNEYSDEYEKQFGERPNEQLFDIFKTKKKALTFLRNKKRTFSNLKEYLSADQIKKLLNNKMFCIVSAGKNEQENNLYENGTSEQKKQINKQIKKRYEELKSKLQSLNVPFYQVYGLYFGSHQLSYIVDLTNDGKNDKNKINSLLHEIRNFCLSNMNQDAVIEGIGKETVFQYQGNYAMQIGENNPYNEEDKEKGRSTIFSRPPHKIRKKKNNPDKIIKNISESFSNKYDFDQKVPGEKF